MSRLNALLVVLALGCTATTAGEDEKVCAPGMQVACACPGGLLGAQSCTADGMAYTKCECGPGGVAGGGRVQEHGCGACRHARVDDTCRGGA